ncbi:MAG TPA: hypothetical protein VM661_16965 [Candidatus Sulfotelmatobacter sp.]|jgi:hypothetical protein|nr:hypothetical protein [Candidatus Sulfotelmatobacter sp.]
MALTALLGQLLQALFGLLPLLLADLAGSRRARLIQAENTAEVKNAQLACRHPDTIDAAVRML